jgi:hypothetical protein
MCESPSEYRDLADPEIEIKDVPLLVCPACRHCHLPTEVIRRLAVILDMAFEQAEEEGLSVIRWTFTRTGHPALGGLPDPVRDSFACLRELLLRERWLLQVAREAVCEPPYTFH